MMTTDQQSPGQTQQTPNTAPKPNDRGSVNVVGFVRIFDPNTKETIVETRA